MSLFSFFKKKQKSDILTDEQKDKSSFDFESAILSYQPGTGKTNLIKRMCCQPLINDSSATIGIEFNIFKFTRYNQQIKGRIYDGPSQQSFRQITKIAVQSKMKMLKINFIVILAIPQFDANFQEFYTHLTQVLKYSDSCTFIICQTQTSKISKGSIRASSFIGRFLKDYMKVFKVFPQTNQGVKQLQNFIFDYIDNLKKNKTQKLYVPALQKKFYTQLKLMKNAFYQYKEPSKIDISGIVESYQMGVGKTSICRALRGQKYTQHSKPTYGFEKLKIAISKGQYQININLMDTRTKGAPSMLDFYIRQHALINQKIFVIIAVPEINLDFQSFIFHFWQVMRILKDALVIVCQVKWKQNRMQQRKFPSSKRVFQIIKNIFYQKIKFFEIYPETGKGVEQMRNFIAEYYINIEQEKQQILYNPTKNNSLLTYFKQLNIAYNKAVITQNQKKQSKKYYYKQLSKKYRNQLIKNGLYERQEQFNAISSQQQKQGHQINEKDDTKYKKVDQNQSSSNISQIENNFKQNIKDKVVNLSILERQLKGVYSEFGQNSQSQRGSFISADNEKLISQCQYAGSFLQYESQVDIQKQQQQVGKEKSEETYNSTHNQKIQNNQSETTILQVQNIQNEDDKESASFYQIQRQFQLKIKDSKVNMESLRIQYEDFSQCDSISQHSYKSLAQTKNQKDQKKKSGQQRIK